MPNGEMIVKARLAVDTSRTPKTKDNYAPTPGIAEARLIIAIAAAEGLDLHQYDVKAAFLNVELKEKEYMTHPIPSRAAQGYVWQINKALFGLREASKLWHEHLNCNIIRWKFRPTKVNPCIYTRGQGKAQQYLYTHVDDILHAGPTGTHIQFGKTLMETYEARDDGYPQTFVGIEVTKLDGGIFIHQTKYITRVIERYAFEGAQPTDCPTPSRTAPKRNRSMADALTGKHTLHELGGAILWAARLTWPSIMAHASFIMSCTADSQHHPKKRGYAIAAAVIQYFMSDPTRGILYRKGKKLSLVGYPDADFAGDQADYKSRTGWVITLGEDNGPLDWYSAKQKVVSVSTQEAEIRAWASALRAVMSWRNMMECLRKKPKTPTLIYQDNSAAMKAIQGNIFESRLKHVNVSFHFVNEAIKANVARVAKIDTRENLGDIFTKLLQADLFRHLSSRLMYGSAGAAAAAG
jgi:hypothetical protein